VDDVLFQYPMTDRENKEKLTLPLLVWMILTERHPTHQTILH
jgi:hypothetical protein